MPISNIELTFIKHDVRIVEIRQTEGFGARWSHDASMFRGFLEPQMENGHEIGRFQLITKLTHFKGWIH